MATHNMLQSAFFLPHLPLFKPVLAPPATRLCLGPQERITAAVLPSEIELPVVSRMHL